MKTRLLPIISILILATFVLIAGRGMGVGAKRQAAQPAIPQAPTALVFGITTRVSVASDGSQGNNYSDWPSTSADGRYVAFTSRASNLVSGDTNGYMDIFVHDRQTASTERVSVASDGSQGNYYSDSPSISADGCYVAFGSYASNLVSGDTNGYLDIFVHDRQTGITERVSVASDGSQGNYDSGGSSISTDGRYVAFQSHASNLVSGDTNGSWDIFVHDRQTGSTERVSVASDGSQGNGGSYSPSISAGGRYLAFLSEASNLVSGDTNNFCGNPPEYNNCLDIFVHDRQTGSTQRVSLSSDGSQGNHESYSPSISADGRYVAFESYASNLVIGDTNKFCGGYISCPDIFVHDRQTGVTQRVSLASDGSQGNSYSHSPSISADGRYVAFFSSASNLVSGDTNGYTDTFVHDRQTGSTQRVSLASDGSQGNDGSGGSSISADGRYVAFTSRASNLVSGDTNNFCIGDRSTNLSTPPPPENSNCPDVFVHDRGEETVGYAIYLPLTQNQP